MNQLLQSKKWLTMLCLGLALSLSAACSDDDSKNKGGDNTPDVIDEGDVISPGDDTTGDDTTGDDTTGDDTTGDDTTGDDTTGDDTTGDDTTGPGDTCDINGLTLPDNLIIVEDDYYDDWSIGQFLDNDQYIEFVILRDSIATEPGTFDFADPDVADAAYLLLGSDCDGSSNCDHFFIATAGTFEITEFEHADDGAFAATFNNVELSEIDLSDQTLVANGQNWCITNQAFTATVVGIPEPTEFEAPNCTDGSVNNGFTAVQVNVMESTSFSGWYYFDAFSDTAAPYDVLMLRLWSFSDDYVEGETYPVDPEDLGDQTLIIRTDCDADGDCAMEYRAGEGQIEINVLDETTGDIKVTITDATFLEVDDNGNFVENGAGWCVDSIVLEGNFLAAP